MAELHPDPAFQALKAVTSTGQSGVGPHKSAKEQNKLQSPFYFGKCELVLTVFEGGSAAAVGTTLLCAGAGTA